MLKKVWTWSCNNRTFLDKITAVRESVREDKPVYYHAPQGYDQFAWFEESADSWEQTLKNRALQIRQSSKKINLLFSGGCDSTKMLQSFVTNNIFIDEITCLKHGILEADFEVTEVAEPYLKKIKHLIPKTKITIKNLTAKDYENYYNDPYWAEKQTWANHIRFRLTHPLMDNTLFLQSDTDTVHVLGRDKPHLVYHNSDWYTYFLDVDIETNQFMNNSNCVFFYADDPAIHAKQCHILKNYIEKNFDIEQYKNQLAISKIDQSHINAGAGRIASAKEFFIRKLTGIGKVYDSNGKQVVVEGNKDSQAVLSFIKDKQYEFVVKKWSNGLKDLKSDIDSKWFNNGHPMHGTVGVFSKFYCLTRPRIATVDELYPQGWGTVENRWQ